MAVLLHNSLQQILGWLPDALDDEFSGHPLGDLLVRDGRAAVLGMIAQPGYKVQGSRGQGHWARTPWIAVFDRLVTESAQRGYYVVYLIRGDGGGVYLSLNQGTTAVHAEVGGRRYRSVLTDRATVYAELLRSIGLDGLQTGALDLGSGGTLTQGYEAGNVAGLYYDAKAVPDEADLTADLMRFLALYRRLVEANDHLADAETPGTSEDDLEGTERALEAVRLRWHLRAERNPKLAKEAKRIHGSACAVCGFEFAGRYGPVGAGFIEAHHLTPFSELQGRPTQLSARDDFAVVCANCHRMIHRRRPPYALADIAATLQ